MIFFDLVLRYLSFFRSLSRCYYCLKMRFGDRHFAENNMAFYALKIRVLFSRIDLVIEDPAIVRRRRDMTQIAGSDRNFFCRSIDRVYRRDGMTIGALKVGMAGKFVPEGRGRISLSPRCQSDLVQLADGRGNFRVKIRRGQFWRKFVTGCAVFRRGQNAHFLGMTGKTRCMADRCGFESSLFQPEGLAQFRGRFCGVFII